jgi:hypothetical protein
VQREWFVSRQLTTGEVVFEWQREFALWGYSGSHNVMLFRSAKSDPDQDGPTTRIDLVFKPVQALSVRTRYQSLTVRVATAERTDQVLGPLRGAWPEQCVLELVGEDGISDHIVCTAVGCHEDDGENWEPSVFATDLADGRTPPWRTPVLGGGPDGEMSARFATLDELLAAVDAGAPRPSGGSVGRYLYVVMSRWSFADGGSPRHSALSAFITRDEAEDHVRACGGGHEIDNGIRIERWVQAVPLDL